MVHLGGGVARLRDAPALCRARRAGRADRTGAVLPNRHATLLPRLHLYFSYRYILL